MPPAPGAGWVNYTIDEHTTATYQQAKRGRPGPATEYRRTDTTCFTITANIDLTATGLPNGVGDRHSRRCLGCASCCGTAQRGRTSPMPTVFTHS